MKNTMRRLGRLGIVTATVAAAGLVVVPSASAASFHDIAAKATNVKTIVSKDTGHGILQLRRGSYNGSTWIWARVSSPDSTLNSGWDVSLQIKKSPAYPCSTGPGSSSRDINGTTYSAATMKNDSCLYAAYAIKRNGNGLYTTATYMP